jgi:hypothetical protein
MSITQLEEGPLACTARNNNRIPAMNEHNERALTTAKNGVSSAAIEPIGCATADAFTRWAMQHKQPSLPINPVEDGIVRRASFAGFSKADSTMSPNIVEKWRILKHQSETDALAREGIGTNTKLEGRQRNGKGEIAFRSCNTHGQQWDLHRYWNGRTDANSRSIPLLEKVMASPDSDKFGAQLSDGITFRSRKLSGGD